MIFYTSVCMGCKQEFKIFEGTQKYKQYKLDHDKKFLCDPCEGNVVDQARKNFYYKNR